MRDTKCSLHGTNLSFAAFLKQPAQWKNGVLGVHFYSADVLDIQMQADIALPSMHVSMPRLDVEDSICEVWHGSGQPTQGHCGAIHYRYDNDVLFGVIVLPEAMFEASADKTPLQQATESAYRQIFSLLDTLHFLHLFRIWNYMADINANSYGLERYVQFNLGRQDAFLAHGRDVVGNVPAACALGFGRTFGEECSPQESLSISFLAGRVMPQCIENPRQISAYEYPQQYGPRSPTFSRASLIRLGQYDVLFLSGTASIVGHASLHPDDVIAQTRETVANIEAVLAEANRLVGQPKFDLSGLYYKVYVRHAADLEQIRNELAHCVGDALKAVYLQADVCRQDLLLEIEATAGHPLAMMSDCLSSDFLDSGSSESTCLD